MSRRLPWRLGVLAFPFLLALTAGCGSGRYPVTGRVTYDDGSPVDGGTVIGDATINTKSVTVQGNIEKDGTFRWGTEKPGDGALPGNYRVIVMPIPLGEHEIAAGKLPAVS